KAIENKTFAPSTMHEPTGIQQKMPFRDRVERKGIPAWVRTRGRTCYCLSYTAVYLTFFPFASVPLTVTVRALPSADTTIRPLRVTVPSFLLVRSVVLSFTTLYDRVSALGSPVRG